MLYSPWKSGIILQSSERGAASKVHLVVALLAKHNQWGSGTVDRTPSTVYRVPSPQVTRHSGNNCELHFNICWCSEN